ncbi:GAF domain-containing protein [Neosynechococcus sphagnicola]|uniref:GAF domain-containing protein n=1 Tax=Neosynechococcus sphagnicola TaxID=1501145 RepID=UPI0009DCF645|nr:GAF domain-containing protein [Neosynechococcus sphagnicola]
MTTHSKKPEQRTLEVLSSLSYRAGELSRYLHEVAQGVSELIGLDWSAVTICRDGGERVLASTLDLGEEGKQVYSLHGTLTGTVFATGSPLVVEDVTTCSDYGQAPEGYRAYLGVPLRTPTGKVIGTICSFHHQPRHFTTEEIRLAEIFAERAATAIDNYQLYQQQQAEIQERQRVEIALRKSEEQLRQLAENLEQVFWLFSRDAQPIYVSPAFATIWGQPLSRWYAEPDIWWTVIHPDDRDRVYQTFTQNAEGKSEEEFRIVRPDGSVRMIRSQGFPDPG